MLLAQQALPTGEAAEASVNLFTIIADWFTGFIGGLWRELYHNFLVDDRYIGYLKGLGVTMQVSLFAALLGIVLGTVLALMRLSKNKFLSRLAGAYIALIRGTPLLLQVLIFNFGIFGKVRIDKSLVGIIACGVNSSAYVAEIIRGGILSVDRGQSEAGRSLGLSGGQTMVFIVFPQALKAALPAMCNEFIVLIKETSVLAYIALTDLTKAADYVRSRTFSPFTPYIIAAIFYLIVITVLTFLLRKLEERLRQGDRH